MKYIYIYIHRYVYIYIYVYYWHGNLKEIYLIKIGMWKQQWWGYDTMGYNAA